MKCAESLNNFFSDAVDLLDIDRDLHVIYITGINNPVKNAVTTFSNHPSILSINELRYAQNNFSFYPISESDIYSVINNIDSSKAYQKNNIPPKVLKDSGDICAIVLSSDMNLCISKGKFPNNLKNADITHIIKKGTTFRKITTEQLVFCLHSLKFMRKSCINKYMNILIIFFLST